RLLTSVYTCCAPGGTAHPPRSKPPRESSSAAPSPCMTPSTEIHVVLVSFKSVAPSEMWVSVRILQQYGCKSGAEPSPVEGSLSATVDPLCVRVDCVAGAFAR